MFRHLKDGAAVVLNGDDDKLRNVREVRGWAPVFYGIDAPADVTADNIEYLGMEAVRCVIHLGEEAIPVRIPYPGKHMVMNALAAASVGRLMGLMPAEIRDGIENLVMPNGRFRRIVREDLTVIDDCYNASPASVKASLAVLAEGEGRRIAVLGDMAELGKDELSYHREVGAFAGTLDLDAVITAGPLSAATDEALHETAPSMAHVHVKDLDALLALLPLVIKKGDTVLVKASHCMHFEKAVELLEKTLTL